MSGFAEYDQFDGLGLADLIRRHEVTPGEVLEAAIARIELHKAGQLEREVPWGLRRPPERARTLPGRGQQSSLPAPSLEHFGLVD